MKAKFLTVLLGLFFGIGLGISQMTRPQKILAFLDILGNWDPSLLLVMVGAAGVYFILHRFVLKLPKPRFENQFVLPKLSELDKRLVIGSALFGIGWGTVGLCPGPSIVALASGHAKVIIFFLGLLFGMALVRFLRKPRA